MARTVLKPPVNVVKIEEAKECQILIRKVEKGDIAASWNFINFYSARKQHRVLRENGIKDIKTFIEFAAMQAEKYVFTTSKR